MTLDPTGGGTRFAPLVTSTVLDIKPYKPGKPIEELRREKGLSRIVKLASNENPLGPSPRAAEAVRDSSSRLHLYPDGFGFTLKEAIARRWRVGIGNVALGNGSSEIIEMMVRLFVRQGRKVAVASPSFSIYEIAARAQGGTVTRVPLKNHAVDLDGLRDALDADTSLVIVGNPNNPTGTAFGRVAWERFLAALPAGTAVLLDEAYAEYAEGEDFPSGRDYLDDSLPLVAARTFSKAHGLAALRVGYALAPAELVDYMNRLRLPFNTNAAAQAAAVAALADEAHARRSVAVNDEGRVRLYAIFAAHGMECVPSRANFVLARVGDAAGLYAALLDEGVIVRPAGDFGMPEWIRVTVGTGEELDFFEAALRRVASKGGR